MFRLLKEPKCRGHSGASSCTGMGSGALKSLMQKSVRRGKEFDAVFATLSFFEFAHDDKGKYTNLWNRITTTSFEDCCDIGTLKYVHSQRILANSTDNKDLQITCLIRSVICMSRSRKFRLVSNFGAASHEDELDAKLTDIVRRDVYINKLNKKEKETISPAEYKRAVSKKSKTHQLFGCLEKTMGSTTLLPILQSIFHGYERDGKKQSAPWESLLAVYIGYLYVKFEDEIGESNWFEINNIDVTPYFDFYIANSTYTSEIYTVRGKQMERRIPDYKLPKESVDMHVTGIRGASDFDKIFLLSSGLM